MDGNAFAEQLKREGFPHTYVWQDGPNVSYPDHTHPVETAHIIPRGEMSLIMAGQTVTYGAGDRCGIPAGTVHSAKMGPHGCRHLIGER